MNQPVQTAFHVLVERFVQRQSLVLDAMKELRPDLVQWAQGKIMMQEWIEAMQEGEQPAQKGYWGKEDEWEYFLHGLGCRLTHTVTQEPLEWDVGDLRTFDRFWFMHWLEWLLYQDTEIESVCVVKAWLETESRDKGKPLQEMIFTALEWLQYAEILSELDSQYKYMLISDKPSDVTQQSLSGVS